MRFSKFILLLLFKVKHFRLALHNETFQQQAAGCKLHGTWFPSNSTATWSDSKIISLMQHNLMVNFSKISHLDWLIVSLLDFIKWKMSLWQHLHLCILFCVIFSLNNINSDVLMLIDMMEEKAEPPGFSKDTNGSFHTLFKEFDPMSLWWGHLIFDSR